MVKCDGVNHAITWFIVICVHHESHKKKRSNYLLQFSLPSLRTKANGNVKKQQEFSRAHKFELRFRL